MRKNHRKKTLKRMLLDMTKTVEEMKAEIATLHSQNDISQEITDGVHAVVDAALPGIVSAQVATATDALQKQITDTSTLVETLVDQLANGNTAGATATAAEIQATVAPATTDTSAAPSA